MLSKGILSLTCLQARALEDLVIPGVLVAVSNLSYRGIGHSHHLPTANAGDSCVFSQHPREQHLKSALEEVSHELPVSVCVCASRSGRWLMCGCVILQNMHNSTRSKPLTMPFTLLFVICKLL